VATITADGYEPFDVADGTRLVRALEAHDVDILHRCGGYARCTTCRVEFYDGEPTRMTVAERDKLDEKGLLGQVRLSCQIECQGAMSLKPLMTLAGSGLSDRGPEPEDHITPEPEWTTAPEHAH
jgi:ferredoxin